MAEGVLLMPSGYRTAVLEVPFPKRTDRRIGAARSFSSSFKLDKECDVAVTGYAWTGQVLAQEMTTNVSLSGPMSDELRSRWNSKCVWYHVHARSAAMADLEKKHAATTERRDELLRMAPSAQVLKELESIKLYLKELNDSIQFVENGFTSHLPTYRVDGRPYDIDVPLLEQGCRGPTHSIDVIPSRVGTAPCVYLSVECKIARGSNIGNTVDSLQAIVPCSAPGQAYSNTSVQDVAHSLQNIFCSRFPEWMPAGPAKLKFHGKILDGSRHVEDVFEGRTSEMYIERMTLILNIQPYVRPVPEEELIARDAAETILAAVVSGVGQTLYRIENPPKPPGPDAKPIRGTTSRPTSTTTYRSPRKL